METIYQIRGLYPKYIRNSYNSIAKQTNKTKQQQKTQIWFKMA